MMIDWISPLIVFVSLAAFTYVYTLDSKHLGYNMVTGVIFATITGVVYGGLRNYGLWKFDTSDWATIEIILFMYVCPLVFSISSALVLMIGMRSPFSKRGSDEK